MAESPLIHRSWDRGKRVEGREEDVVPLYYTMMHWGGSARYNNVIEEIC